MPRPRSRSPRVHEPDELMSLRTDLLRHVEAFNTKADLDFDRLIQRYRNKTIAWSKSGEHGLVIRHAVHVCAWMRFGTRTFQLSRDDILSSLASLLSDMLDARGKTAPCLRLAKAVRFISEMCEDFVDSTWAPPLRRKIDCALSDVNAHINPQLECRGRGPAAGKQLPPGTHGRTDHALVRHVLGDRVGTMPPGTKIYWDGLAARWYAIQNGKRWNGADTYLKNFASDELAIERVFSVVMSSAGPHGKPE
eukprot:TRINITY_DN20892_c0_g1_i1.p1 TRINITY_DN20892_c0_g1~~TRINITY_DN20892_c0_g1_i1.p1  ORF type:complete len:263 (-),score=16.11 TRINITY_DN20892_c0_g1_i1:62-811(-)